MKSWLCIQETDSTKVPRFMTSRTHYSRCQNVLHFLTNAFVFESYGNILLWTQRFAIFRQPTPTRTFLLIIWRIQIVLKNTRGVWTEYHYLYEVLSFGINSNLLGPQISGVSPIIKADACLNHMSPEKVIVGYCQYSVSTNFYNVRT